MWKDKLQGARDDDVYLGMRISDKCNVGILLAVSACTE